MLGSSKATKVDPNVPSPSAVYRHLLKSYLAGIVPIVAQHTARGGGG